jgi:competence protein ComEA
MAQPVTPGHHIDKEVIDEPVDLNAADFDALYSINGIGASRARAILRWREEHGPFEAVEDLQHVPGFKPEELPQLRPWLKVDHTARKAGRPKAK